MIISIINKEGKEIAFNIDNINDDNKKKAANAIVRKVATLEILNEALSITNHTHRLTLENLLMDCDEAKIEEESNDQKATD